MADDGKEPRGEERFGIGGNNPPPDLKIGDALRQDLEFHQVELLVRTEELLDMADRFDADHATVESDEDSGILAAIITQLRGHFKVADNAREAVKAPYLEGSRIVDGFFKKNVLDRIETRGKELNTKQTAFGVAKAARAKREAEEAAAAARAAEDARRREAERAERDRLRAEKEAARIKREAEDAARKAREEAEAAEAARKRAADEAAERRRMAEAAARKAATRADDDARQAAEAAAAAARAEEEAAAHAAEVAARQAREREETRQREAEEAAAAADERQREADERARDAREAEDRAHLQSVQQTTVAESSAAERSRTRGDYAMSSLRTTWKHEVVDITKVPVEYLLVNDSMVKAAIKGRNGKRDIPGLRIFSVEDAVNR